MEVLNKIKISNKSYDRIKWVLLIVVPLFIVLLSKLGEIWGFDPQKIVETLAALAAFFGGILGISSYNYSKTEEGVQDTFNDDSFLEMMGVEENEDEKGSAEE